MPEDFTWRDGSRLIRFGEGAVAEAPRLIDEQGLGGYVLLTTERAAAAAPALADAADTVLNVPSGKVDELSAALVDELGGAGGERPVVGLGGGRVMDTAKSVAGATSRRCGTIPTTLSGAEMTPIHRLPAGVEGARFVRPSLVVADPELMASAPTARLAASAMNALAHAMEALYVPLANPVASFAALRAAELLSQGIAADPPDREQLALGAILAGYASGSTGIAVHHAVCQTIVRTAGTPHAETNAVMLPHSAKLMSGRAPRALAELERALGDSDLAGLAARSGHSRLASLGVEEEHLPAVVQTTLGHPAYSNTPDAPDEDELLEALRGAL